MRWRRRRRRCDPSAFDSVARTCRTVYFARVFRLKRSRTRKHISLGRCRRCSRPRRNVLVECRSGIKHICHTRNSVCVPTSNVLVERRSPVKHKFHIFNAVRDPGSDVLVECNSMSKHMLHTGCLLYTSPSPRDRQKSRMPSSA